MSSQGERITENKVEIQNLKDAIAEIKASNQLTRSYIEEKVTNGIAEVKKVIEDHMKEEEEDNDEQNKRLGVVEQTLVTLKVWMSIGGFIAAIVIPSIWALIWGRILNAEALQSLISFIPWVN